MAGARRTGRRADYAWNGGSFIVNDLTSTKQVAGMVTVNQSATLVRTRGEILFALDGAADGVATAIGLGMIVGNDDQFTAGATAFPSPISDLDADWLWHGFILLRAFTASQSETLGSQVGRIMIDSKAMRKVRQNDQVGLVMEASALAGSPSADGVIAARFLFSS